MQYFNNNHIFSVINQCDLKSAFTRVIDYYDPNKKYNKKTKVLDCSFTYSRTNNQYKLYNIEKTRNLNGNVKNSKFEIIIYEPPKNKNFENDTKYVTSIFKNIISKNGIIIVKSNDFKEKGNPKLHGSFNIWKIFDKYNFYLYDNIVYTYNKYHSDIILHNRCEIIHSYFMIFKTEK